MQIPQIMLELQFFLFHFIFQDYYYNIKKQIHIYFRIKITCMELIHITSKYTQK